MCSGLTGVSLWAFDAGLTHAARPRWSYYSYPKAGLRTVALGNKCRFNQYHSTGKGWLSSIPQKEQLLPDRVCAQLDVSTGN